MICKPHGGSFQPTEDLLICKAYIAASEDNKKGKYQEVAEFKHTLWQKNKSLLQKQEWQNDWLFHNQVTLAKTASRNKQTVVTIDLKKPKPHEARTAGSIHQHFKEYIAKDCMVFVGICSHNKYDSGTQ